MNGRKLERIEGLEWARSGQAAPGQFDYYLLTLTWEPGYCAVTKKPDPAECRAPNGFAVHGLWPQYNGGDWPEFCSKTTLSPQDRSQYGRVFASPSLIQHEWDRHGTCSGLAAATYFQLIDKDFRQLHLPMSYPADSNIPEAESPTITADFIRQNKGLAPNGILVKSNNGQVTEVDICVTKAGQFRAC